MSRKHRVNSSRPNGHASPSSHVRSPSSPRLSGDEGERALTAQDSATVEPVENASAGQSGGRDARSLIARGTTDASGAGPRERRFSAAKKAEAVERLMRGESLDVLSRELAVTAATLSEWRDAFRAGGEAALKSRQPTVQDDEILHLKAMIGDLAMRNELLAEKARLLEANHPSFPWRRSRG